jgi:glutathione synthase/RimK-type ligase-like ATP-grasp enzyme
MPAPESIAYATYVEDPSYPDSDVDLPLVREAFARRGVSLDAWSWDDDSAPWADYPLVLVRSTWDYTLRYPDFLAWARRVAQGSRLLNPLAVIERNTDKTYLQSLESAGVPVVPTRWYVPGEAAPSAAEVTAGAGRVVVKPAISAGARDALLTSDAVEAAAHVGMLLEAGRVAMVQPYLEAVDGEGEYSVIVIGGRPSHAITKVPALTAGGHGDARGLTPVTDELSTAALQVLRAEPSGTECAWARVDLVRDDVGVLRLMELELTEPLLFLYLAEGSADRLVDVVLTSR